VKISLVSAKAAELNVDALAIPVATGQRLTGTALELDRAMGGVLNEMIVNAEHKHMFIAHHDHDDAYASIDGCVDKLERQLSDLKDKYRNRKHSGGEDKKLRAE